MSKQDHEFNPEFSSDQLQENPKAQLLSVFHMFGLMKNRRSACKFEDQMLRTILRKISLCSHVKANREVKKLVVP